MAKRQGIAVDPSLLARLDEAPALVGPVRSIRSEKDAVGQAPMLAALRPGGLKANTVGQTIYLPKDEKKRLKKLAIDWDVSVHELVLDALDEYLEKRGVEKLRRYSGTGD